MGGQEPTTTDWWWRAVRIRIYLVPVARNDTGRPHGGGATGTRMGKSLANTRHRIWLYPDARGTSVLRLHKADAPLGQAIGQHGRRMRAEQQSPSVHTICTNHNGPMALDGLVQLGALSDCNQTQPFAARHQVTLATSCSAVDQSCRCAGPKANARYATERQEASPTGPPGPLGEGGFEDDDGDWSP